MCPLCFLFSYQYHRTETRKVPRYAYGQIVAYVNEPVEWERRVCGVCGSVKEKRRKPIRILNEVGG